MEGSSVKLGIEAAEPPAFQGPGRSGQLSRDGDQCGLTSKRSSSIQKEKEVHKISEIEFPLETQLMGSLKS